jgi:hypothetical protein
MINSNIISYPAGNSTSERECGFRPNIAAEGQQWRVGIVLSLVYCYLQ